MRPSETADEPLTGPVQSSLMGASVEDKGSIVDLAMVENNDAQIEFRPSESLSVPSLPPWPSCGSPSGSGRRLLPEAIDPE